MRHSAIIRLGIWTAATALSAFLFIQPFAAVYAQNGAPTVANAAALPHVTTAVAPAADVRADNAVVVQDANAITIPAANWIDQIAVVIRDVGTAALPLLVAFVLTLLPAPIRMIAGPFLQKYSSGILDKALDYGINAVKGATKDKPLTIPVGNQVIAHTAQYFIDHAPGWLTSTLGGEDGIRQKIFARLNLPVDAGIEDFDQVAPAGAPAVVVKPAKGSSRHYPLPMGGK